MKGLSLRGQPIEYLRAVEREFTKGFYSERRMEFGPNPHYGYRNVDQSTVSGRLKSQPSFDNRWDCPECREYLEYKEGERILEGFDGKDMWVTVGAATDRERLVGLAETRGHSYVAVPIINDEVAVLTTGPLVDESEQVVRPPLFITKVLMRVRWYGPKLPNSDRRQGISSSRDFLPPARKPQGFWEAYHKGTSRRCWHSHPDEDEAKECSARTGQRLDGSSKGWYVRPCSEYRRVGRLTATVEKLEEALATLGILSWRDQTSEQDAEKRLFRIEAMEWDDRRFVMLREMTGWKKPYPRFVPPPFAISVHIDIATGRVQGGAS